MATECASAGCPERVFVRNSGWERRRSRGGSGAQQRLATCIGNERAAWQGVCSLRRRFRNSPHVAVFALAPAGVIKQQLLRKRFQYLCLAIDCSIGTSLRHEQKRNAIRDVRIFLRALSVGFRELSRLDNTVQLASGKPASAQTRPLSAKTAAAPDRAASCSESNPSAAGTAG